MASPFYVKNQSVRMKENRVATFFELDSKGVIVTKISSLDCGIIDVLSI